jgi:ABC-2 type transport system permease protein
MPIFDQGYQHWSGELTGHAWRWLAITRHGIRIGMKNRLLRIMLMLAWLPAVVLAFSLCVWGLVEQRSELVAPLLDFLSFLGPEILADPKAYRVEIWTLCYEYFLVTEMRFSMILVLLVGPSLISRDLRFNALPLYFSRPMRRIDYFIGKLGVVGYFLGLVLIVPTLIAYVLGLLFSLDISIIRDTFPLLLAALGYGILMTVSAGLLILALSSLSRNSRYVGLFWLAVWFVTSLVGTVLETVNREQRMHQTYRRMAAEERALQADRSQKTKSHPDRQKQFMAQQQAMQKVWAEIEQEELHASKTDWRPMVSYTANLTRVGKHWLGTDACWERLSQNVPEERRPRFLLENKGPQYPWYWSAAVLAFLFGISVCILNFRVRSLDRLK